MIRVATVLSPREWEPALVGHARETAAIRIVLRAFQPLEIEQRVAEIDAVVAGGDISWVTPGVIRGWRRAGLAVIGIFPLGDRPAAMLLEDGGAHETLPEDASPETIVHAIRFQMPAAATEPLTPIGAISVVTSARGAPGCTEMALALAWNWSRRADTVLIDLDLGAPSLAVRLGLPPRPDVTDASDEVRSTGRFPTAVVQRLGALDVVTGSHRVGEPAPRPAMIEDLVEAAASLFDHVVIDLGPLDGDSTLLKRADDAVLVADAAAVGVVRAARVVAGWSGPQPRLILNRAPSGSNGDVVDAVRRWTGLEPAAVVAERPSIRRTAVASRPPDRRLRRALATLRAPQ